MSTNDSTQVFTANILHASTKDWSTVVGSGGGYYLLPISITTHHQRVTEIWVRLSDGREVRLDIGGDFPVLPGHRIACLTDSKHILAARNFNTGAIQWFASAKTLAGRFKNYAHWIMLAGFLPAIICAFIVKEFQHFPNIATNASIPSATPYVVQCIMAVAIVSIGIDAIRYVKYRMRVASYQSMMDTGLAKLQNAVA